MANNKGDILVTFPSQNAYVHMITTMASNAAKIAGFDKSAAGKVAIATDEAVTNVIKHAYQGQPDKQIKFRVEITPESLVLSVIHSGRALSADSVKLPVMDDYIRERRRGGLGLYIMKQFMDKVDYMVGEESCCRMTKYLDSETDGKQGSKGEGAATKKAGK
jgi:serine/threonine-protein kinase RsbW